MRLRVFRETQLFASHNAFADSAWATQAAKGNVSMVRPYCQFTAVALKYKATLGTICMVMFLPD